MKYRHSSTREKLGEIIKRDGNKCWLCGGKWSQIDHVVPKAAGGLNNVENLQLLCRECHEKKTREVDLPRIRVFKRALKKEVGVKRLHYQAISWEKNKVVGLTLPPNPFLDELGFRLNVIHLLTTQCVPAYHPFFERDFCALFVNGKRFDGWVSGETISFKNGLREPLSVVVEWGSMCDRAMCNPAYVFDAELQLVVHEKKLTAPGFLLLD